MPTAAPRGLKLTLTVAALLNQPFSKRDSEMRNWPRVSGGSMLSACVTVASRTPNPITFGVMPKNRKVNPDRVNSK